MSILQEGLKRRVEAEASNRLQNSAIGADLAFLNVFSIILGEQCDIQTTWEFSVPLIREPSSFDLWHSEDPVTRVRYITCRITSLASNSGYG